MEKQKAITPPKTVYFMRIKNKQTENKGFSQVFIMFLRKDKEMKTNYSTDYILREVRGLWWKDKDTYKSLVMPQF